jgi:hypothetical protein
MGILDRLQGRGTSKQAGWGPTQPGGVKAACEAAGILPDQVYHAVSANSVIISRADSGVAVVVQSWEVWYRTGLKTLTIHVPSGAQIGEGNVISRSELLKPGGLDQHWTMGTKVETQDMTLFKRGPIGPFRYDFLEAKEIAWKHGWEVTDRWMGHPVTFVLRKVEARGDIKVVWVLRVLSDKCGVVYVDANAEEVYTFDDVTEDGL